MSFNRSNGGAAALRAAETQVGIPYVWGGETPGVGFDCSGLVQWAYGTIGVSLPRSTIYQYTVNAIPLSTPKAVGDLLFFTGSDPGPNGEPGHVGFFVGYGAVSADQHAFIPEVGGAAIFYDAPYTGDPGGIRYDYVGQVVALTRPANALPPAPPITEEDMVVLTIDPKNGGYAVVNLATGTWQGIATPAMLSWYQSCGVKNVTIPAAVFAKLTQNGTIG